MSYPRKAAQVYPLTVSDTQRDLNGTEIKIMTPQDVRRNNHPMEG